MNWKTKKGYKIQRILTTNLPLLVSNGANYIMIDTGRKKGWNNIDKKLDEILGDNKIKAIILTHTHPDHTQTVNEVVAKYGCKVLVHENIPYEANLTKENLILVNEGYNISYLGFEGKIIHIPGHSIDSIGIIIDDVLMIGDIIGEFVAKPYAKKQKVVSNITLNSLKRLINHECKRYFPAHKDIVYSHKELKNLYNRFIRGEIIHSV